jgi:hypothetical protein
MKLGILISIFLLSLNLFAQTAKSSSGTEIVMPKFDDSVKKQVTGESTDKTITVNMECTGETGLKYSPGQAGYDLCMQKNAARKNQDFKDRTQNSIDTRDNSQSVNFSYGN